MSIMYPEETVSDFLSTMENRDLATAQA